MKSNHARAFTLTELLVALFMAGLLMAIVAGAVQGARRSARERGCVANLQRLSAALALYAGDYDDIYPSAAPVTFTKLSETGSHARGDIWCDLLAPYIHPVGAAGGSETMPHCPDILYEEMLSAVDFAAFAGTGYSPAEKLRLSGYAYNVELSEKADIDAKSDTYSGKGLGAVKYDALTVSFAESRAGVMVVNRPDERVEGLIRGMYIPGFTEMIRKQPPGATRHRGGANYAFCDGHIQWLKPEHLSVKPDCDAVTPGFGL